MYRATPNEGTKDKLIKVKESIEILMNNLIPLDSLESLSKHKNDICGKVDNLWECVHAHLKRMPKSKNNFETSEHLKNDIYKRCENNDFALEELSKIMKCHLIFYSLDNDIREIHFGKYETSCLKFLHIGKIYFIPLKSDKDAKLYTLNDEDKQILESLSLSNLVPTNNKHLVKNQEMLLRKLTNTLIGMQRQQGPLEIVSMNKKRRPYYEVYTDDQLNEDKSLKLCVLNTQEVHSGVAVLIDKVDGVKFNQILLKNRKNCGYNAFQGDKVYVKISNGDKSSGKVVGVAESNHKPINSLYICRVCKDQGNLMKPLDNSFPKIRVDNGPGRKLYEIELSKKDSYPIERQQMSEELKKREKSNFADDIYVTIYNIRVEKNGTEAIFNELRIVKFDPETCEDLFIVCYEYWDISFMYPNGKVVGILSTFDSFEDSLHLILPICKIESQSVPDDSYKREISIVNKKVTETKPVLYEVVPRGATVFTIDGEETQEMDDALSYHIKDDVTVIGVHITDVTKFISPQHEIYKNAKRRFSTLYPPKQEPIYLWEKNLSTNLFSLLRNEPRAVLSVMFHFKAVKDKPHILNNVTFHETFIISEYKLSYKEVEGWINATSIPNNVDQKLFDAIKECYEIAKQIRRVRLPHSYFVQNKKNFVKFNSQFNDSFNSKLLIEEFMILTNEHVAQKIYRKYPNMSLLRVQDPVTDYDEWVKKIFTYTNMNFISSLQQCCKLLKINRIGENRESLIVSRQFYNDFILNLKKNVDRSRNMLRYDKYFNDFYVYLQEWNKMNPLASYECSVENSVNNAHFSLDKKLYTHFTSPVRRFSDVIVHRLLKSTFEGAAEVETIDENDVIEVCKIGNKNKVNTKLFKELCVPYALFEDKPYTNSFIIDCVCKDITKDKLHLLHPLLDNCHSDKSLKFSYLSLDESPVQLNIKESTDSCCLKWKKIIFSYETLSIPSSTNKFVIDSHLNDAILPDSAHNLFREIRCSYISSENLYSKLFELSKRFCTTECNDRITSDSNSLADPIIDISLTLCIKNTVRVQFCSHIVKGLKKVAPELFIVSPTLQLCLIHHEDPVLCFVPGGKLKFVYNDVILKFDTVDQFKEYFIPLIYTESLMEILAEKSEFTLVDVPISWRFGNSPITNKEETFGILKLRKTFYTSNNIIFSDEEDKVVDRYEYIIAEGMKSKSGDLLCLRSKENNGSKYWIGHGEVLNVCKLEEEDDTYKIVFFMLTHCNKDIFKGNSSCQNMFFSVDVYLRSIVSKRQLEAVVSIDTKDFMKQVILGYELEKSINCYDQDMINYVMNEVKKQKIPFINRNQEKAIKKAMTERLSLIWGPPGTGKTSIGCILAFAYVMKNSRLKNDGIVLYCGPSNDCVNLVALEMQKKFINDCPKLLRIFGKQQELADFPLPGFFTRNTKPLDKEMQEISLHFLIRNMNDTLSETLLDLDAKFKDIRNKKGYLSNDEDARGQIREMIKRYKSLLNEAKAKLIEKEGYNMILCTTSVSTYLKNFKITQVIIDEAGMCKEPETLIPILMGSDTVENMVLIGDHKQLRPIIHSAIASKRGLQISMFERYQTLRRDLVTMLNYQYRMHPSICEFPSKYFYESKLITQISVWWTGLNKEDFIGQSYKVWNGIDYTNTLKHYKDTLKSSNYCAIKNEQWPGQRCRPYICFKPSFNQCPERLVFIDVVGDETVQSVSTATGGEYSRANEVEVEAVGYIYKRLIDALTPPRLAPNFVSVLTQYKLQESKLFKKCKDILLEKRIKLDPIVKTVIRSQGSENDYIIFSTVRSLRNSEDIVENPTPGWEQRYLGFITDRNQVNVALTRARKGLIIIGNKNLLSANRMWRDIINDLKKRGCVVSNMTNFYI